MAVKIEVFNKLRDLFDSMAKEYNIPSEIKKNFDKELILGLDEIHEMARTIHVALLKTDDNQTAKILGASCNGEKLTKYLKDKGYESIVHMKNDEDLIKMPYIFFPIVLSFKDKS